MLQKLSQSAISRQSYSLFMCSTLLNKYHPYTFMSHKIVKYIILIYLDIYYYLDQIFRF